MGSKLLEINDMVIKFNTSEGTTIAVNKLNMYINKGETLGIVGESGSGKSVTALGIMGLIPDPPGKIENGSIDFEGRNLLKLSEKEMESIRGNEISMIFQEPMTSLNPILTCGFQIAEMFMLHKGMKKKDAMKKAVELLKMVGIPLPEQRAKEYPHQLSGGMRQRVMISIALACKPKLLIADEPTTALDVTIQAQIIELMKKLKKEMDTAIIMITHDLGVVAEMCDRVIVMYTGHVVEEAEVSELFSNPKHPYTKGLLKSIPKITPEKVKLTAIDGMVPNPNDMPPGCTFCPRCCEAIDKCKIAIPDIIDIGGGHFVRCWLHENLKEASSERE